MVKQNMAEERDKKKVNERYRRISLHCIDGESGKMITESASTDMSTKILIITITSLATYYCVYQVVNIKIKQSISTTTYYAILFLIFSLFIFFIIFFVWKKDFNKTQYVLYTFIYTLISVLGVVLIIIRIVPFTTYEIINVFVVLLIIQTVLFYLLTPVTRKMVCRV